MVTGTALDTGRHSPGSPRLLAQSERGPSASLLWAAASDLRLAPVPPAACDVGSDGPSPAFGRAVLLRLLCPPPQRDLREGV